MSHPYAMEDLEATTQLSDIKALGIRFDRNELAGAFGDIGTDLPLIVGMILAANLGFYEGKLPLKET